MISRRWRSPKTGDNVKKVLIGAGVVFSFLTSAFSEAPFPVFSAPRAVTAGPHDHLLANYFAINAWRPDNRYLLVLATDLRDRLPDGAACTLGLVDTAEKGKRVTRE